MPFTVTHPTDDALRVEGEPFYALAQYTLSSSSSSLASSPAPSTVPTPPLPSLVFRLRAFDVLPPCDAIGLLSGVDSTGLIVWGGALALLEWLAQRPGLLHARATAGAHFVELGCGSGVLAVGLCALLRGVSVPGARVCATDGNPDCVALTQRNLAEQCAGAPTASAEVLQWGDAAAAAAVGRRCAVAVAAAETARLTVVSADVLYDAEAVPLLVATVRALAESCAAAHPTCAIEWWIAYTPRSLTRAGNEAIFAALQHALEEHGWSYDLHDLPPKAVTTGFEGRADCAVPALLGCILVVRIGPEAPPPPLQVVCCCAPVYTRID